MDKKESLLSFSLFSVMQGAIKSLFLPSPFHVHRRGLVSGCSARSIELDLMILMSLFQLEICYDCMSAELKDTGIGAGRAENKE